MVYGRLRYRRKRRRTARTYKRKSRRVYRRAYRAVRKKTSRMYKSYGFFNKRTSVTHVWRGTAPVSVTSGGFIDFSIPIRLNSVFDPWVGLTSAINTVANGYDLYHSLYGRYCVTGAKCYVTMRQRTCPRPHTHIISGGSGTVAVTPWQNPIIKWGTNVQETYPYVPAGAGLWIQAAADPNTKMKTIQPNVNGNAKSTIVHKWSARKWFGTKDLTGSNLFSAVIGTHPATVVYLNTWAMIADYSYLASEVPEFDIDFFISYKTHWMEQRNIASLPSNATLAPR